MPSYVYPFIAAGVAVAVSVAALLWYRRRQKAERGRQAAHWTSAYGEDSLAMRSSGSSHSVMSGYGEASGKSFVDSEMSLYYG